MMRRHLVPLVVLSLSGSTLAAQQSVSITDSVWMTVEIPAPPMLSAFPSWWRDSVVAAWIRNVSPDAIRALPPLIQGTNVELMLQLLRNGDLYRARLSHSTGIRALDSLLLHTSWTADRALAYPKFPLGVEGAGTEVALTIRIPITALDLSQSRASTRVIHYDPALLTGLSPACDSALKEPTVFVTTTFWGKVDSATGDPDVRAWAGRALTSIQPMFRSPERIRPVARPRAFFEGAVVTRTSGQGIGWLRLKVDPDGQVRGREMLGSTGYPDLDRALLAMIDEADSAHIVPPPPGGGDSTIVDLTFDLRRIAVPGSVALGQVSLGQWSADRPPQLVRVGRARYPERLRSARVRGRVEVAFVIDTLGHPIPGSITILSSPHPGFSDASAAMVLESRFTPARARGCAVPILVQQRINYTP